MREHVPQEVLDEIAQQYRAASEAAVAHFEDEKADEDGITASLGTELRNQVNGRSDVGGARYVWSTRQIRLRGRGKNAPEKAVGADAVLSIELHAGDDVVWSKLVPIQAKKGWKTTDHLLEGQVRKMIDAFGSALVVDYSPRGYVAADGAAVLAARGDRRRMSADALVPLGDMLAERFIACTIGTQGIRYDERTRRVHRIDGPDGGRAAAPRQVVRTTISVPKSVSTNDKRQKNIGARGTKLDGSSAISLPRTASTGPKMPSGMRAAEGVHDPSRQYGFLAGDEAEWQTRRHRIDPRLDEIGWCRADARPDIGPSRR